MQKNMLLFLFFFAPLLGILPAFAQNFEKMTFEQQREAFEKFRAEESDIMISRYYRRGPHLIYDCEEKHFACVSPLSRQRCEEKRQTDLERKKIELSCAPLKQFDSAADCERTQQDVMYRLVRKEFCWNLDRRSLYEY